MDKTILALVITFAIIPHASQMFLPVTSRPLCLTVEADPGKEVNFFYDVTGNNPENMKVNFEPQNRTQAPYDITGKTGKTKFSETAMKICFISTDGGYKSVSIDFYNHDVAHLAELASKSDIYELHTKLIDVGEKIKEVNKNEIFEEERQSIHGKIVEEH